MKTTYKQVRRVHPCIHRRCLTSSRLLQLALKTHPDKNPDDADATAQFQKISQAYSTLLRHLDRSSAPSNGHSHGHFHPFGYGYDDYDDEDDDDYDYEDDEDYYDDYEDDYEDMEFYRCVTTNEYYGWRLI